MPREPEFLTELKLSDTQRDAIQSAHRADAGPQSSTWLKVQRNTARSLVKKGLAKMREHDLVQLNDKGWRVADLLAVWR